MDRSQSPPSDLLDHAGLQLQLAEAVDPAADVVVTNAVDQANVAHLRSRLDRAGATFDLEVLYDHHGIAVGQRVADRISNDGFFSGF